MTDRKPKASGLPASPERRRFLLTGAAGGLASAGALAGTAAAAGNPENLPPNVADWSRYLGSGVDAQPYGVP